MILKWHSLNSGPTIHGSINKSTIKGFYGAKEEDTTRTDVFEYTNDEPISLLGTDKAVNPAEYLLHALAGCITTTIAYHAAARGITIYKMESKAKGKLDLQGLLGIDPNVRPGFQDIEIGFNIQSDADEDELMQIIQHSVILDTVQNTVPVQVKINQ